MEKITFSVNPNTKRSAIFKNQYTGARITKATLMVKAGLNPFPNGKGLKRTISCDEFMSKYSEIQTSEKETILARIKLVRKMGKMIFLTVADSTGELQVVMTAEETKKFNERKLHLDVMDFVEVKGEAFLTQKGQLSIKARTIKVIGKSMAAPVGKHDGLSNEETRVRQRYLDMNSNPEVRETLIMRSKMVSLIRRFFEKKEFLEVETPMMNAIPGGANAKPFVTHHNALGVDRYMRIAPELYLKKLVVGGMEKVFEIGKNFRNEGIDPTHNPEFTSIEFYEAFATYEDHMKDIEKLMKKLYKKVYGNKDYLLNYGELEINLNNFKRIPYREAITTIGDIPEDVVDDVEPLSMYLREQGVTKANGTLPLGKLWELAFDEFVEAKIVDPVFITEYPADISPLARRMDDNPSLTERFELFIAGREIANGFNELNNPFDQYERFQDQVKGKDSDDESMHMDEDFIEALKVGLPACAGTGIGIDRLVMLFTNSQTIRDVIAFPAVK